MDSPSSSRHTSLRRIVFSCTVLLFLIHTDPANDRIFPNRPTGWDTLKKIKIQEGNLVAHKGRVNFNEWVPKPVKTRSGNKDLEVIAKEEQLFLETLNRELEKSQSRAIQGNDVDQQHKKSPKNRQTPAAQISALKSKVIAAV